LRGHVAPLLRRADAVGDCGQRCQLLGGGAFGTAAGCHAFQCRTDFIEFPYFDRRHLRDGRASKGHDLHQPFGFQLAQRLTHQCAADAQKFAHMPFNEPRPGPELALR